jgi:YD repeat-containing protein
VNSAAVQYDATSNLTRTLTRWAVYAQTRDRANRLAMVTSRGVTVTFGYDAAGALAVKTVRQGSAVTTTHYIGGYYERTVGGAALLPPGRSIGAAGRHGALSISVQRPSFDCAQSL